MQDKISHLRWWIIGLLIVVTGFFALDRQSLGILAMPLQAELALTAAEYGQLITVSALVYALAALPMGLLMDLLGTRWGLALSLLVCLVANLGSGAANSLLLLMAARGVYSLGAPGAPIASAKVVAEWMPPQERGTAFGIFAAGSDIARMFAPLLLITGQAFLSWRGVLIMIGLLGLPLLLFWLWAYRRPAEHAALTEWELTLLENSRLPDVSQTAGANELARWASFWGRREAWLLIVSRVLTDQLGVLLTVWMPFYLNRQKSFSLQDTTWVSMAILLPAALGSLFGGVLSDWLIRSGWKPLDSRIRLMTIAAVMVLVILPLPWLPSLSSILVVVAIASLGTAIWHATMNALIVDLTPARCVGSVMGGILTFSALVRMVFIMLVGYGADAFTNGVAVFIALMSLLYLVALGMVIWAARPQRLAAASA